MTAREREPTRVQSPVGMGALYGSGKFIHFPQRRLRLTMEIKTIDLAIPNLSHKSIGNDSLVHMTSMTPCIGMASGKRET